MTKLKIKKNCWEVMQCGRDQGACPTASTTSLDGANNGKGAGRACWVVPGTYCDGTEQRIFAFKYHQCRECPFYQLVKEEEGDLYVKPKDLLLRLNNRSS